VTATHAQATLPSAADARGARRGRRRDRGLHRTPRRDLSRAAGSPTAYEDKKRERLMVSGGARVRPPPTSQPGSPTAADAGAARARARGRGGRRPAETGAEGVGARGPSPGAEGRDQPPAGGGSARLGAHGADRRALRAEVRGDRRELGQRRDRPAGGLLHDQRPRGVSRDRDLLDPPGDAAGDLPDSQRRRGLVSRPRPGSGEGTVSSSENTGAARKSLSRPTPPAPRSRSTALTAGRWT
jgi:hypothetical protein